MNFFDWMNMNMIIDIAFIVFSVAAIWKLRQHMKINNKIQESNIKIEEKLEMHKLAIIELIQHKEASIEHAKQIEQKVVDVTKNPQAARRKLKQSEQYSNIQ
tara:strand:+ start:1263 stop:1568 length:306 start_codon:yes stop_codon:yes gene_type:complete